MEGLGNKFTLLEVLQHLSLWGACGGRGSWILGFGFRLWVSSFIRALHGSRFSFQFDCKP